jgi:hypothetical protein
VVNGRVTEKELCDDVFWPPPRSENKDPRFIKGILLDCISVVNEEDAALSGLVTGPVDTRVASVLNWEIGIVVESRHDGPEHKPFRRSKDITSSTRDSMSFCWFVVTGGVTKAVEGVIGVWLVAGDDMPRMLNRSFKSKGGLLVVIEVDCAARTELCVPDAFVEAANDVVNVTAPEEAKGVNSPPRLRISSGFGLVVLGPGSASPRDRMPRFKDAPRSGGFGLGNTVLDRGVLVIGADLPVDIDADPAVAASE